VLLSTLPEAYEKNNNWSIISWHIADGGTARVPLANNEYQVRTLPFQDHLNRLHFVKAASRSPESKVLDVLSTERVMSAVRHAQIELDA
jgi:hypothetical protein